MKIVFPAASKPLDLYGTGIVLLGEDGQSVEPVRTASLWDESPAHAHARSRMPVWFHELYTGGIHPDARFPRDRYNRIAHRLSAGEAAELVRIQTAPMASRDDILLAHDARYVDRFLCGSMDPKERRRIGLRPWTPSLIPRTLRLMGGAIAALNHVSQYGGLAANMAGGTHHAHRDFGSGYCVFNDLAVCAKLATQRLGFQRVVILDLDVHQGDGTATILEDDSQALTVSVHCGENFPFRKAVSDHDLVVGAGTGDEAYLAVVAESIEIAMGFGPELLLFQGGVDGLETDALGRLALSRLALQQRNRSVYEAAVAAGVPCVVFMGGGYSNPIGPTVDAFTDLFIDAARANAHVQRSAVNQGGVARGGPGEHAREVGV